MKHTYKMIGPTGIIYENSDLNEFIKEAERLKNRRTGRTTRMLFRAIGTEFDKILIVTQTSIMRNFLINELCRIFESLEFKYEQRGNIITNFGKEYRFLTKEQFDDPDFWDKPTMRKYQQFWDEV
jgi:hypothetical protein